MIMDATDRHFKKLRVSLTHECNYACVYCADDIKKDTSSAYNIAGSKTIKSTELIEIIKKLHTELQLDAIRFTGGEPLLHPRIRSIIAAIYDLGIANIGMTTNGHLLYNKAKDLYEAGLQSVNISLDAITSESFKSMSLRDGLQNVLRSIDTCLNVGLTVKLNTVVVADKNHDQILPLLKFAMEKNIIIRFLELMHMGPLYKHGKTMLFSSAQMLETIGSEYPVEVLPRETGATADYWSVGGKKTFGIIANDSSPFCSDCNRLRLDSYGNLYGCLSSLVPVPVSSGTSIPELRSALQLAITHKQPARFTGNPRTMQSIGG